MRNFNYRQLCCLVLLLFYSTTSAADVVIFRWNDDKQQLHFSDLPRQNNKGFDPHVIYSPHASKSVKLQITNKKTAKQKLASKKIKPSKRRLSKKTPESNNSHSNLSTIEETVIDSEGLCQQLKKKLAAIESNDDLFLIDKSGKTKKISEKKKDQLKKHLNESIKLHCKPNASLNFSF